MGMGGDGDKYHMDCWDCVLKDDLREIIILLIKGAQATKVV